MRKSQIISLVILLVLVTVVIWVGAFTGNENPEAVQDDTSLSEQNSSTEGSEEVMATPEITNEEIAALPTTNIEWSPEFKGGVFSANEDAETLENMAKYDCVFDGTSFGQEGAYITFDVGYGDEGAVADITAILDGLKATDTKAIFFVTDAYFTDKTTELTKRIVNEGHQIGSRGIINEELKNDMSRLSISEYNAALTTVEEKYKAVMGQEATIKYFRPIGGNFSIRDLAIAKQRGYTTVLWTTLYASTSPSKLNSEISDKLYNKAIFAISSYSVDGSTDVVKSALETASSKYAIKQLP